MIASRDIYRLKQIQLMKKLHKSKKIVASGETGNNYSMHRILKIQAEKCLDLDEGLL